MVLTTATDVNQTALDQFQARVGNNPKIHIEGKVLETKLGTERALLAEKTAYEMMNAGEIPVMKIKKYPALAGPVPQGYFDSIQVQIKELKAKGLKNLTRKEKVKYFGLKDELIALEKQETAKEKQETAKEKQETAKEKQETAKNYNIIALENKKQAEENKKQEKQREIIAEEDSKLQKAYEEVNLKLSSIKGSLLGK